MDSGRYVKWHPLPGQAGRFYCEALIDDWEGFRILLGTDKMSDPMMRLTFPDALLYRNCDESHRLAIPGDGSELDFPHPFYTVENSALLADFHRDAQETMKDLAITHYAIYTANDCIDVLSPTPPVADILS